MRQAGCITDIDLAFCEVLGCVPRPRGTKICSERWMVEVAPPRSCKEQIDRFYYWNEVLEVLVRNGITRIYGMEFFIEEFGEAKRSGIWQWLWCGFLDIVHSVEQFGSDHTVSACDLELCCDGGRWDGDVVYFRVDYRQWRILRAALSKPVSGIRTARTPADPFGVRVDRIYRIHILKGRTG